MPNYVWILIMATVTAALCFLVSYLTRKHDAKKEEPVGTLHIADDPDDGPYLFLELSAPPENLYSQEYVTFWVDNMPFDVGLSVDEAAEAISKLATSGRSQ